MKRKDVEEVIVNDDFTLSSPALKIRRLDGESMPLQDDFMEQLMESSSLSIDELKTNSVALNEERAIVLFNSNNITPSLQSTIIPFTISSADSDFLSRFKNPVIWSNRCYKAIAEEETQNQDDDDDDDSGMMNGCLAVVPWVPSPQISEVLEAPNTQTSDAMPMDLEGMDIEEDDYNSRQQMLIKHEHVWNQWQPHCMIQQPPNNFSTPITWFG